MYSDSNDRRLLGEILVAQEWITPHQLEEALQCQNRNGRSEYLGEILVRLGYAEELEIVTALGVQCNLPFIAVSKQVIPEAVLGVIPPAIARRDRVIPLDLSGNILSVVMQDPLQDEVREEMERFTGCSVATFISTPTEIEGALAKYYPLPGDSPGACGQMQAAL